MTTLPTYLPPTPTCQTPVRILVHPYDIPVSFTDVRDIVPRLYDAYSQDVDIWLHLGVRVQQDSFTIESQGHRDGYHDYRDITGYSISKEDCQKLFEGCPDTLETTIDLDDVFSRWRSRLLDSPEVSPELGGVMIRKSKDPGHFICDFLYYTSLAEHWKRRKKDLTDGEQYSPSMPVLLMNVPTKNSQEQLRRARHVTVNLLRSLAESHQQKKTSVNAATHAASQ